MSDELQKANDNIVSTQDLGEGRKQVTFSVSADNLKEYMDMFNGTENIQISDEGSRGNYQLGKGSVMSRYEPSARQGGYPFTSNDSPYTQVYANLPIDPHKKIKLAVELYFKEPIVGSVIDMMVDFSASGFTNECDDAEVKKIYDKWCEEMNINELLEKIFLEYYRSGNVTVYRSQDNAKVKRKRRKAVSGEVDIQEYQFPSGYSVLNPMNVYVNGSMFANTERVQLKVTDEMSNLLRDSSPTSNTIQDIPPDIARDVRNGGTFVTLNPELTSRITRKKMDYERYASPFLERVFEPIMYKAKLRLMDMSTIEGLVNQLVTVTIGDKDFPATDEDLEAVAALFQTPNKAYTVFWNHTLKVTFHKPEGIDTLTGDKYAQVNEDIMAGLGVSRSLLDGGGGGSGSNFSNSWISILSFIERLENARNKVKYWIENEYRRIARENGFKSFPKVRFNKMNLREDTYISDVLLAMYDRGLIDEEDILTETGREYNAVVDMKKRNDKNAELFFPPEQPFQGGNSAPAPTGGAPKGTKQKQRKTNPESNSGKAPKARKATASYSEAEEDYANELSSQYLFIESEVERIVEQHKDEEDRVKEILIASAILSLFKVISQVGYKYIDDTFDDEISNYTETRNTSAVLMQRDLRDWNDGYVMKLANDIIEEIKKAFNSGKPINDVINGVFAANKYRVGLISQSGIVEAVRQASIIGNEMVGKRTAIWQAHLDDRTCNTCRGLHGRSFGIADVPPRPHSGCRCTLHFN
jgi:hypothetical protein